MRKSLILSAGASSAAVLISSFIAGTPALAEQKVGVAAAVKPEATSQPPGGDASTLRIGKSVVYNERIDTSGSGQVQVLLLDGSTFTVGPGSSLVIDKFVYNPGTGKGALVASFSKGALRFVGGKLSKSEPGVKVNTLAGALTVRGGIFTAKISGSNKALITFDYGISLSILRPWPAPDHQSGRRRHLGQRLGPRGDPLPNHGRRQRHARRGGRQELEEDQHPKPARRTAGPIITASSRPAVIRISPSLRRSMTAPRPAFC
jgi:FecR-like protein